MNETDRYNEVCKPNFDNTNKKLDKILSHLEGNGKVGLLTRVDRIEQKFSTYSGVLGWLSNNWKTILIVVLLGYNMMSGKTISKEQINEIAKELDKITVNG